MLREEQFMHRHDLGVGWKCGILGPKPELLNRNLHLTSRRWSVHTLKLGKPWSNEGGWPHAQQARLDPQGKCFPGLWTPSIIAGQVWKP